MHCTRPSLELAAWIVITAVASSPTSADAADAWTEPYPGVRHLTRTVDTPLVMHLLAVDLCATGVSARSTRSEDRGRTTSRFAGDYGLQVAVNGGFYDTRTYAPVGLAMGGGERWGDSGDSAELGFIGFDPRNRLYFSPPAEVVAEPPPGVTELVSGMPLIVEDGRVVEAPCASHFCARHPRTGVGVDRDGETLFLAVVDGRRAGHSVGATTRELGALMADLGAWRALNLDGGGSTTMYVAAEGGIVNRPSDGAQRSVSNHLGLTAGGVVDFARCCRVRPVEGLRGHFVDVEADHWAGEAIEALRSEGVTTGCQADPPAFCPQCPAERAQAAVFVARARGAAPLRPARPTFEDLPPDHFAYGEIEALAAAGVIRGCQIDPPLFCPERPITRAEVAALLMSAVDLEVPDGDETAFDDVPRDAWYAPAVEALRRACIASGCRVDPPAFCPEREATRAELAVMIARAFELADFRQCDDLPDAGVRDAGGLDAGGFDSRVSDAQPADSLPADSLPDDGRFGDGGPADAIRDARGAPNAGDAARPHRDGTLEPAPAADAIDDGGCHCRAGSAPNRNEWWLAIAFAIAFAIVVRGRRRARRAGSRPLGLPAGPSDERPQARGPGAR